MAAARQIAVIGGGHIGQAVIQGLLACNFAEAGAIRVSCRTPEHTARVAAGLGVVGCSTTAACVRGDDWVVIALRPRDFAEIAGDLARGLTPDQAVLSVMGAVSLGCLTSSLEADQVARAIPALSAARRKSVTPWTASRALRGERRHELQELLDDLGGELYFEDERLLDASASVGACAVAYHLELVDVLTSSAIRLGCTPEQARHLVEGSLMGAAALLEPGTRPQPRTVQAVAHPGGATDLALRVLRERGVEQLFGAAVDAAAARLAEVSRQFGHSPFASNNSK